MAKKKHPNLLANLTEDDRPEMEEQEAPFVKHYLTDVNKITDNKLTVIHDKKQKLLVYLINEMNAKTNKVMLDPEVRNNIIKILNIKQAMYYTYIQDFMGQGLMTMKSRCIYMLNPHLFSKTKWNKETMYKKNIEYFELRIKYNVKTGDKTISTKRIKKKKATTKEIKAKINKSTQEVTNQEVTNQEVTNQEVTSKPSHDEHIRALYKWIEENITPVDDNLDFHIQTLIQTFTHNKNIADLDYGAMGRYIKKSVDNYLMDKNKTKYKSTKESLTDYSWAT